MAAREQLSEWCGLLPSALSHHIITKSLWLSLHPFYQLFLPYCFLFDSPSLSSLPTSPYLTLPLADHFHSLTFPSLQLSWYSFLFSTISFPNIDLYLPPPRCTGVIGKCASERRRSGGCRHLPPAQLPVWGAAAVGAQIS